jgi:PAS domain S-box-containing protein
LPNPAPPSLLEILVTRATTILGASHGFLYVETPEGAVLERKVLVGNELTGLRVRADEGVIGRVWRSGQPEALDGVLGVPLRLGPSVVGVLGLAHEAGASHAFGEAEVRQLSGFAQLASIALDHTRFFETEHELAERKRAQDALEKSEARSRSIVESAYDAFVSMDAEGRITGWNAQAEATFGWTASEALGRSLADTIIPVTHREAHRNGLARYLATGKGSVLGRRLELTGLHRNGQEFPVELTISAVRSGEDQLFHAFIRDISERKRVEQLREDLTRTMVHDLRSPLAATQGFLEMLESAPGSLSTSHATLLGGALRGTRKVLGLIDQILDVSRLQKGVMPIEKRRVAVGELVSEVLDLEAPLAHEKNLRFARDIPVTLPCAWVDPGLVSRVLQNLVGNAIKFTPEDGLVRIGAWVETASPSMLRVAVEDSGPGVPAEMAERVFETFVTGGQMRRGSGLGLAFCRLAVEAHGGRIWVESGPDKGAAFFFTLPADGSP